MYLTYCEYVNYGYNSVPPEEFNRYSIRAEAIVRQHTFNRIKNIDLRPSFDSDEQEIVMAKMNQTGLCEIVDELYFDKNPHLASSNKILSGFSNEGYSESYTQIDRASANNTKSLMDKIVDIINLHFTREQLYRGVK